MNAEKTFNSLVKIAREHGFTVKSFRGGRSCEINGDVYGLEIRINSGCTYGTRVRTLIKLLSTFGFYGMNNGYAAVYAGQKEKNLPDSVANFALNIMDAIQAG